MYLAKLLFIVAILYQSKIKKAMVIVFYITSICNMLLI